MTNRIEQFARKAPQLASTMRFLPLENDLPKDTDQKIRDFLIAGVKASNVSSAKKTALEKTYSAADFPLTLEQVTTLSKEALGRADSFLGLFPAKVKTTTFKKYLAYLQSKENVRSGIVGHYLDIANQDVYARANATGKGGHMKDALEDAQNGLINPSTGERTKSKIDQITDLSYIIKSTDWPYIERIIKRELGQPMPNSLRMPALNGTLSIAAILESL